MSIRVKKSARPASLDQTRGRLMTERLALKNKAGNILSACGVDLTEEALSSEKKLVDLLALPRNEIMRRQLRVIVEQILVLNRELAGRTIGVNTVGACVAPHAIESTSRCVSGSYGKP
jgi:hypothetical protein